MDYPLPDLTKRHLGVQLDSDDAPVGNPNPNPHAAGTPLLKDEAHDREMLDTAIRCALKLGDHAQANWTNNPGLGHTAGEALLFANEPWGAISALLHATRRRIPSHPVLSLLARALHAASTQRPNAPLEELANVVAQYAERTKPAFERGLFPDPESTKVKPKDKVNIPSEGVIRAWATEAGLDPIDVGLMVALCGTGDADGDDTGERSVRTL
ncbi:unnamed protein product [Rhizoctonia solani]|nr:unnamed protein product [Rhizoctonia solani]